jgi:hypothetical protein
VPAALLRRTPRGEPGPAGKEGASGTTVVAGIRNVGSVASTTAEGLGASIPVTGGSWTQGAQELDQLVGEVAITLPTQATCMENQQEQSSPGGAIVHLQLDGSLVGTAESHALFPPKNTEILTVQWNGLQAVGGNHLLNLFAVRSSALSLLEPGTETARTLTAAVADNCGANGASGGGHVTVDSVKIDALGAH